MNNVDVEFTDQPVQGNFGKPDYTWLADNTFCSIRHVSIQQSFSLQELTSHVINNQTC